MPEILNIGFDLEEIRRFNKYLNNINVWDGLLQDLFSADELKRNFGHTSPDACFTLCFCFKEALSKALGKSWMNAGTDWKNIELIFDASKDFSSFHTRISGEVSDFFRAQGGNEIKCELSCDQGMAGCKVIIFK